jgi:TusA-related sulfurtransferase
MTEKKTSKSSPDADHILDITRDLCPMTFVRTRLMLDRMAEGEILLVLLKGAEPIANVPRAASALGHGIVLETADEHGVARVFIRKARAFGV